MKRIQVSILLILTLIQNVNSQDKEIKGDTSFYYNHSQELVKELKLTEFDSLQTDFFFRFRNHGQFIEIFKTNNQLHGELTNFIYHSHKKSNDTLYQKILLDSQKTQEIYEIIQNSGILALPSDNGINDWSQGYDGITYFIEHSDKTEYWFKHYWTPAAQDSIPESLLVMDFVKALSETLQLSEKYIEFKEDLPCRGCYNSDGMTRTCYLSNSFGLGYHASTKLPLGFSSSAFLTYIGKTYTSFGFGLQYKFDRNDNYDFGFYVSKSDLFIRNSKTNDFLTYNYQKRKLDFFDTNTIFQNHQLSYAVNIKNKISLFTGLSYLIDNNKMIGGNFGVSKWFSKPKIDTNLSLTIFEDDIDYKAGISKPIHFNSRFFISSTSIGLSFENFKDYNDLNINLTIWL